jgi:hypothetical protein
MTTMRRGLQSMRVLGMTAIAIAGMVACSSDEESPSGSSGSGGSSASGGSGGSNAAGKGGTSGSGKGGSSGSSGSGSSGKGGQSGSGGSASGAMGGEAGTNEGGTGGSSGASGSAGTSGSSGSAGSAGTPGECGAFATIEDGLTPSREVFVDASATGPGDGSEADPYTELEAALGDAAPGTAIRIRPGTYAGGAFASGLAGTESEPIWIGGVPGEERPVIQGGSNAIQLSAASYLIVHDLEITGQESNGLNIDDAEVASGEAHHLVFRDLYIHDLGDGGNQDCLKLSGIDDFIVLDSEFVGCSGGSAVDHVGCHRGIIARNTFRDLGGNGVQSKGGSDDILITQNTFIEAGQRAVNMGGSTGFEFFRPVLSTSEPNFEARDIRVIANLFQGGISPIAFVGCVDCIAANNTVIDPVQWVFRILQETTTADGYEFLPAQNGRFVNNVVYFSVGQLSTYVNVGGNTSPETFELANNLWYAHDEPGQSEPSPLPVAENGGIYGMDPAFAGASGSDFHLTDTSPAAGAGVELSELSGDRDGVCYASPPSLGAFELAP